MLVVAGAFALVACAAGAPRPPAGTPEGGAPAALPLVPRPSVVEPCTALRLGDSEVVAGGPEADESYVLEVAGTSSAIVARRRAGLAHARTTLDALWRAPPGPCLRIEDAPRLRYRGMHLDVARHFFDKDVVKRYVELLALYKLNVFHWHLTDDQGFRLELKRHPELVAAGGQDGFYTQDDVREVVAFAKARGVMVVPEIEMPGHARAILAAHPELSCTGEPMPVPRTWGIFEDVLCAGNEATFALVADVLDEVASLFPGPLLHVGGDEVPKTRWSACPKCAARMKAEGLSASSLQGWFMARVARMVAERGRRAMVWDDALDPRLPKDVVVVAWQSKERGAMAAAAGHDVVMAPHDEVYFDVPQSRGAGEPGREGLTPWSRVRAFDPGAHPRILGGEGALWTEHVSTEDDLHTLVAPRIAALSDALWAGPSAASSFPARFVAHRPLLDRMKVRYFVEPPQGLRRKKVFIDRAELALAPSPLFADGVVRLTRDGSEPTPTSAAYAAQIAITETTNVAAALFVPNGRKSVTVRGLLEKQTPRPAPGGVPGRVEYKYYEGDFRALPDLDRLAPVRSGSSAAIGFDRAFRSERFAVRYDLAFEAKATGVYRFTAHADDGVRVLVDGEKVVEDDGEHAARDADGEIALGAGVHRMRVEYFQGEGDKELSVSFALTP